MYMYEGLLEYIQHFYLCGSVTRLYEISIIIGRKLVFGFEGIPNLFVLVVRLVIV